MNKGEIEPQSQQRYCTGAEQLNKQKAPALIEELFEMTGATIKKNRKPRYHDYGKGQA